MAASSSTLTTAPTPQPAPAPDEAHLAPQLNQSTAAPSDASLPAPASTTTTTTTPTLPARADCNEPFPSPSGAFVPAPQCEGQLSAAWPNGLPPAPPGHGHPSSSAAPAINTATAANKGGTAESSLSRSTSLRRTSSSQPPTRPPSLPASEVTLDAIIAASNPSSRPTSRRSSALAQSVDGLSLAAASPKGLRPLSTSGLGRDPSRLSIGSRSGKGSNSHSPADSAASPLGPGMGLGRSDSKRSSAGRNASSGMQRQGSASGGTQQPESIQEGISESATEAASTSTTAKADSAQGPALDTSTRSSSLAQVSEDASSQAGGGAFTPIGKSSLSRATSTTRGDLALASTSKVAPAEEKPLPEVKIRDFGFPESDPRFQGIRPPGFAEEEAARAGLGVGEDEDDFGGFAAARGVGGFKGGAAFGLGGAGAVGGGWRVVHGAGADEGDDGGDGGELGHAEEWQIDGVEEDDEEYDEDGQHQDEGEGLPLGVYRAAYAFEAESEHELSVEVGAVVDVVGALEGGWAIAVLREEGREEGTEAKRGLVPESYLEWMGEEE